MKFEEQIQKLESLGLPFDGVDLDKVLKFHSRVEMEQDPFASIFYNCWSLDCANPNWILFVDFEFDDLDSPYASLIHSLCELAGCDAELTDVVDGFDSAYPNLGESFEVSYRLRGVKYTDTLEVCGDWCAPNAIYHMIENIENLIGDRRFYAIHEGQSVMLLCLPEDTAREISNIRNSMHALMPYVKRA